jgi:hypothetical protein
MALDFNLLRPASGLNPVNAFFQGQQATMDRGMAQQKMAQDQEVNALRRQQLTGQIQEQERAVKSQNVAQKTAMFRERLLRARDPNSVRELVKMQYADPDVGAVLSQGGTLEQALAEVPDDPVQLRTYLDQEAMGMAEWIKSRQPKMTPTGDVYDPANRSFIRKPQAAPAPVAPSAPVAVMGPDGRPQYVTREQAIGMTPFSPAAVKVMGGGAGAGGGRAAPTGKAPPGYRYTPTGDLEAIPGGPAAVKQGEVQSKQETGRLQAFDILDSLGDAYSELDRMKAIPSQQRGALSNVLSSVAASPVGQVAERALGTNAQTQRDVASSARLQLFAAVKNATGLSSQQLNSNVEFTTWLNSLTDPSRSIETNKTILENMRKFVDSNGTYSTKQGGKPAQPASGRSEGAGTAPATGASNIAQERASANAAIAAGAPAAAVRQRFKQNTGQEL